MVLSDGPVQGNSEQYALRKLRKSAPELHARVLAGELSGHAAMVQAGFRKPTLIIPADPAGAGRKLARHFTRDQQDELIAAMREAGRQPEDTPP